MIINFLFSYNCAGLQWSRLSLCCFYLGDSISVVVRQLNISLRIPSPVPLTHASKASRLWCRQRWYSRILASIAGRCVVASSWIFPSICSAIFLERASLSLICLSDIPKLAGNNPPLSACTTRRTPLSPAAVPQRTSSRGLSVRCLAFRPHHSG